MSGETAQGFASAALRHVRDARFLLDGCEDYSSPDQAWHLAGFGPECIRKACLASRDWDKVLGHDLGAESDAVLRLLIGIEPGVTRYRIESIVNASMSLSEWEPGCRYKKSGSHDEALAKTLTEECEAFVHRVACELWMDGVLIDINS
jgi:hypothetical protein